MSAPSRVALFALLALAVAVAPLAAGGSTAPAAIGQASADQTTATPSNSMQSGTTAITIQLRPNGDAAWTITTRIDASTDTDRSAFRELANRYENGQATPPWLDRVRAAAAASSEATGRPMNITEERMSSDVQNGTLSLHFTWTNFAREEADHMVIDDVFNTTRGTWFDGLTENQQLTFELPSGHAPLNAPDEGRLDFDGKVTITWDGPQQFEPGYMEIIYSGNAETPTTTGPGNGGDLLWSGFFVVGIGIVAVGAYVISRRRGGRSSVASGGGDGPDGPSASVASADATGEPDAHTATAGTVEPTTADADDGDEVDEELLSDEERVERLLESNGGRMKQANIVTETGWSNAKVSQLLSTMEDDGVIDKLRIGRENLISFPEEDVTDLDQE